MSLHNTKLTEDGYTDTLSDTSNSRKSISTDSSMHSEGTLEEGTSSSTSSKQPSEAIEQDSKSSEKTLTQDDNDGDKPDVLVGQDTGLDVVQELPQGVPEEPPVRQSANLVNSAMNGTRSAVDASSCSIESNLLRESQQTTKNVMIAPPYIYRGPRIQPVPLIETAKLIRYDTTQSGNDDPDEVLRQEIADEKLSLLEMFRRQIRKFQAIEKMSARQARCLDVLRECYFMLAEQNAEVPRSEDLLDIMVEIVQQQSQ